MSNAAPSIRQLKYLITLAETLNFHRASEKLFITQSTLSSGIKELENILDVVLVERTKRIVRLTPTGREVVDRARSILAEMDDLIHATSESKTPLSGTINLGIIPTIAPFLLPAIIPKLKITNPKLKLYLREDLSERILDQLRSGSLDFAIIALPYGTDGLVTKKLFKDEFWWVAKSNQTLAKSTKIYAQDMDLSKLLLLEEGHCLRDHTIQACRSTNTSIQRRNFEATSLFTLLQMVDNDFGFTLLPEMVIKAGALVGTDLIARPFAHKTPFRDIALIRRKTDTRKRDFDLLAQAIIENRRKHVSNLGSSRTAKKHKKHN